MDPAPEIERVRLSPGFEDHRLMHCGGSGGDNGMYSLRQGHGRRVFPLADWGRVRDTSGGVIKLVGIGETASSSSDAEEGDLDKVGDGVAYSVPTLGSGANHLEGGNSSEPVVLVRACPQNRWRGVGEVMLSASSPSLVCVCSFSTGESDRGGCGSVPGSGGITEGFVSGVLKDLKRCSGLRIETRSSKRVDVWHPSVQVVPRTEEVGADTDGDAVDVVNELVEMIGDARQGAIGLRSTTAYESGE